MKTTRLAADFSTNANRAAQIVHKLTPDQQGKRLSISPSKEMTPLVPTERPFVTEWIHDLRNPVCKILFASSLLNKEIALGICSNTAEYTAIITTSCHELMVLADRMARTE